MFCGEIRKISVVFGCKKKFFYLAMHLSYLELYWFAYVVKYAAAFYISRLHLMSIPQSNDVLNPCPAEPGYTLLLKTV